MGKVTTRKIKACLIWLNNQKETGEIIVAPQLAFLQGEFSLHRISNCHVLRILAQNCNGVPCSTRQDNPRYRRTGWQDVPFWLDLNDGMKSPSLKSASNIPDLCPPSRSETFAG